MLTLLPRKTVLTTKAIPNFPQTSVTLPPLLSPLTSSPCAPPLLVSFYWQTNNLNGGVDEPLEDNDSALHLACLYGHLPCVQLLLERGANMEIKDEDEAIPLHDACAGGYLEIVELHFNRASDPECVKRM
ncbi:unnamed protein product [Eruca vesicaria subsp. sativa]|uniref:Uncharacterized protein n=1 Tax=Eruca vesicaria subsp. sativa TaxID=29727 RepID=A0ABC8K369_ERUVS|nr:unnamed protein product [Eruca vesicaria subsp. sativa]